MHATNHAVFTVQYAFRARVRARVQPCTAHASCTRSGAADRDATAFGSSVVAGDSRQQRACAVQRELARLTYAHERSFRVLHCEHTCSNEPNKMPSFFKLLMLLALTATATARMRRPWESEEDYEHNKKHGIMSRTPPKGWSRSGANSGEVPFPGLSDEARAHCTKNGHQCDQAERSAPCLLAQNGYLAQIEAFKAAGYLTAQDLVDGDFT